MNIRQVPMSMVATITLITRAETAQMKYAGLANWAVAMAQEVDCAIIPAKQLQSRSLFDMASVGATNALGAPLGALEIKEAVGRVLWVSCERAALRRDPLIPLAMVYLDRRYERAYCNYVRHIARFTSDGRWWERARKLCDRTLAALSDVANRLTKTELAYLVLKLQVPLAWPVGMRERY